MLSRFFSSASRLFSWLASWPVPLATLLVVLYGSSMVAVAVLLAAGRNDIVQALVYSSTAVAHGQIWRLVTYPFVNPPTIWFALEMVMLYYFGRVVEAGLGSRIFALLYAGLMLLNAGLLQLASSVGFAGETSGVQVVNFAIFAAFVTMHPRAPFFFGFAARWMLVALLALSSLQLLADHQWWAMIQFVVVSASSILFMKWRGYREALFTLPISPLSNLVPRAMPEPAAITASRNERQDHRFTASTLVTSFASPNAAPKKEQAQQAKIASEPTSQASMMVTIDQLLDKISQTGMTSLTDQEKAKLEEARMALLKRDRVV